MSPGADDVEVRHVGPDAWRTFRAVRQRSLREEPDAFASSAHRWSGDWDREPLWRERLTTVHTVVALDEGDPVGTAGLHGAEDELVGMWVAEARRGAGIGRRLVEALLADHGGPVKLRVMAANTAAVSFYERCGFVLTSAPVDDEGCVSMLRPASR